MASPISAEMPKQDPASSNYQYTPLLFVDSVRLLRLQPGRRKSPIEIRLKECRLRDEWPYEALSYSWASENGDAERSSQLNCQDRSIWVTKTCEAALRRLRNSDSERILWVDAVCINQDDDQERGHQVQLMKNIYSKASQVLVWLGEESETIDKNTNLPVSGIFFEYFGRMAAEIRELKASGMRGTYSNLYQELLSQSADYNNPLIWGLRDVVCRRWWSRVWVAQEVSLAKKALLICSKKAINYEDFYQWQTLIVEDTAEPRAHSIWFHFGQADNHHSLIYFPRQGAKPHHSAFTIIKATLRGVERLQASNPRDKIFGILGLFDPLQSLFPLPDYSRSPVEIFTDVTKSLLAYSKSLDILDTVSAQSYTSDFPSWVKDWSTPSVLEFPQYFNRKYKASKVSKAVYILLDNDRELKIKGGVVDSLRRDSFADMAKYVHMSSFRHQIPQWEASIQEASSLDTYPTGEVVSEVIWRTLCWNTDKNYHYPASVEAEKPFLEWYNIIKSDGNVKAKQEALESSGNNFSHLMILSVPLSVTEKGFLAAVPCTAQAGDIIVVLTGGQVPYVLRPVENHYRWVGPCYVHGIMDGEAFPDDPTELEWFSIR